MSLEDTQHNPVLQHGQRAASVSPWPRTAAPARVQQLLGSYVLVPAFAVTAIDIEGFLKSYVVQQFNFVGVSPFSFSEDAFTEFSQAAFGAAINTNCMFVLRWYDGDGNVFRYILKQIDTTLYPSDIPFGINFFPVYEGQIIPLNFSIEIWSQFIGAQILPPNTVYSHVDILAKTSLLFTPSSVDERSDRPAATLVSSISIRDAGAGFATVAFAIPFTNNPLFVYTPSN